jgi:biotin carboxyl carrier protein
MDRYPALVDGLNVDVEFERTEDRIKARVGDRTYQLEAASAEPGVYWLEWNHRSIEAVVRPSEQGYVVTISSSRVLVELLDTRKALRRVVHSGQEGIAVVRAPMPGKVVRILTPEGNPVEVSQGIVVMEAMKMQNEIKSPKRGRIQKLSVSEGSAVNAGDVIAVVE